MKERMSKQRMFPDILRQENAENESKKENPHQFCPE